MKEHYHVYGVGAALVDTEINVTDTDLETLAIKKGSMILLDETRRQQLLDYFAERLMYSKRTSGGSTANTMTAIAQFGGSTFYACKVGDDDNGRFYLQDLQMSGVDCQPDKCYHKGHTGTCLVMITPDAERTLNSFLGVNAALSETDIVPEAIVVSDYVYIEAYMVLSTTSRAAAIRIREIAKHNNIRIATSLSDADLVTEFHSSLSDMLGQHVDLLFCNKIEALRWAQTDDLAEAINCLKQFARTFAITLGANGALVYDGTSLHNIEPFKVKAVDTSGAGDMFAGAFLYAVTHGEDFCSAGRFANFSSATAVSQYGARLSAMEQKKILASWKNLEQNQ